MSTPVRTLPIRVPPWPGEALDSWLEALAHRLQAPLGELAPAIGLTERRETNQRARLPDWTVALHGNEAAAVATATELNPAAVEALTLARYDGHALRLIPHQRRVNRNALWGRANGSRFCPTCLGDGPGRWQLSWRLGWSFACSIHQCLLVDSCPGCGRLQRTNAHPSAAVPQPGRCARPGRQALGKSAPRCGADLAQATALPLTAEHPILRAQRLLLDTITSGTAAFGVYAHHPQSVAAALGDIRALAQKILTQADPTYLAVIVPHDVLDGYQRARDRPHSRSDPFASPVRPGILAPARAVVTAIAVTAALDTLGQPEIGRAALALRQLLRPSVSSLRSGAQPTSPVLQDLLRTALTRPTPSKTGTTHLRRQTRTAQIPTQLWPIWAVRLAPPRRSSQPTFPTTAHALSMLAELHGTGTDIDNNIGVAINNWIPAARIAQTIRDMEDDPRWPAVLTALDRLVHHLDTAGSPIDYARRRRVPYPELISQSSWADICQRTDAHPGQGQRRHTAQLWLFERLSGMPADLAPPAFAVQQPSARANVTDFPRLLTPAIADALDEHATAFLHANGINDEPVTWHPPLDILDGLDLPGPDPYRVDIAELHRLISHDRLKPREAARKLGTTIDAVRCLRDAHPTPKQAAPAHTRDNLRDRLSPEDLFQLHHGEHLSITTIARRYDVSPKTINRLFADHGVPRARRQLLAPLNTDWLYHQYVIVGRTIADIAHEIGASKTSLTRKAKAIGITLRPRGGATRRTTP